MLRENPSADLIKTVCSFFRYRGGERENVVYTTGGITQVSSTDARLPLKEATCHQRVECFFMRRPAVWCGPSLAHANTRSHTHTRAQASSLNDGAL